MIPDSGRHLRTEKGIEIMEICKKRRIRTGLALLCSLAVVFSVFPAYADDDIESLEDQTSALESELQGINQEILSLSEEISSTEMQVEILNGEIARTEDSLAKAETNEQKQYDDMKTRIKYMYENGNATLLEMLFSAEDMADFLNKADFIENLSQYDRDALNELIDVHQQIEDQMKSLEEQQASMADLQDDLADKQAELQAKAQQTSTNLQEVNNRLEAAKKAEEERLAREQAAREKAEQEAKEAAAQAESEKNSSSGNNSTSGTVSNGGGSVNASVDEITLFAALLDCEAVHDYNSMLAVATVVMNRVESSRFGNSIRDVIYAPGQFEPVWTGRLDSRLDRGPTSLARQVAQDAVNGARLAEVADCYYFLYAPSTSRDGIVIGDNLFFTSW